MSASAHQLPRRCPFLHACNRRHAGFFACHAFQYRGIAASSRYHPEWVIANGAGANALWLAEWLAEKMDLRPGMRVLDLGCGKATSAIFLAREFGVSSEPLTTGPMRALPILLLFGAMFYWLWRVRRRRALPVVVRHDSPLTAPAE